MDMDGGVWETTVHGITKSQTQLSNFTSPHHLPTFDLILDESLSAKAATITSSSVVELFESKWQTA